MGVLILGNKSVVKRKSYITMLVFISTIIILFLIVNMNENSSKIKVKGGEGYGMFDKATRIEIIFNDNSILKDKQLYDNTCMLTNYNRYNYNILNNICDEYIYISDVYNKLCSTVAFSNWCNIDCGVIDNWRLNKESSPKSYEIWEKLQGIRKDCIKDRAYDNKSPVGAMFVGNNEFGMNQPGIGYEATQARALTANDLPQLGGSNSQTIKALSGDNVVDNAK
jgi:hypothetical protein